MVLSVCNNQLVLLPALALALRRHGETLPQHLLGATFQPLWECLRSALHADRADCTASEMPVACWAIRCLRRLASLTGDSSKRAALAVSGDEVGSPSDIADADAAYSWSEVCTLHAPNLCDASDQPWHQVAEHLRVWTTSAGASGQAALLMAESLELWSVLIVHNLAPPPRVPDQLLCIKQLSELSATTLVAVAAFFSRPAGGFAGTLSDQENLARQRGVNWVAQALAPQQPELIAMTAPRQADEPPNVRGVADALRALCLGLCPTPAAVTAAATLWWQDDAKEHSRLLIRRGVEPITMDHTAVRLAGSAVPSSQNSRLALPATKALLAHAGKALASALDGAQEAAHIFALQAVAAEVGLAATAAVLPEAPPEVWSATGSVALSSASALERAQGLLMERSAPARLFSPRLLASARSLGAAAALEPASSSAPVDPLGDTILQLRHALLAAATTLQTAVTTQANTSAARLEDDLFFDEGDFGQAAGAAPARASAATQHAPAPLIDPLTQMATATLTGSISGSEDPLEACIGVIAALGVARPVAAADTLISLLHDKSDVLPQSALDAVLSALCGLHGAPPGALTVALSALGKQLQQVQPYEFERVGWLLRLLGIVSTVLLDFNDTQADSEMLDADADVSEASQPSLHTARTKLCMSLTTSHAALRTCGVTVGVALVHATFSLVRAVRDAPDCLAQLAVDLVKDPRYAVRCAMASRFAELLSGFAEKHHQDVMEDVSLGLAGLTLPAGALGVRLSEADAEDKARQETTLLLLGEAAVASGPLEARCVYNIINLAVDQPCHVPMALRVLTAMAKRMGYADRFALIAHHIAFIAHQWTCSGRNVDSLVHAAELLAPRADLTKGCDIVRSYARFLLPRLVECNDATSVSRIAELCGLSTKELFMQHGARTLAALHAFRANGGDAGKAHFRSAFGNDAAVIKDAFPNAIDIYKHKWPLILRELLRMVPAVLTDSQPIDDGAARPVELQCFQPSMSLAATLAAVNDLEAVLNKPSRADAQLVLWSPEVVAEHLLFIHGAMDQAKSPRHRVMALNSLSALLQLIEKHRKARCAFALLAAALTHPSCHSLTRQARFVTLFTCCSTLRRRRRYKTWRLLYWSASRHMRWFSARLARRSLRCLATCCGVSFLGW